MSLSAVITPPTLQLNSGAYKIAEPDPSPGPMIWRRTHITSPFRHGSILVTAVKENPIAVFNILITGTSGPDLQSKKATLLRAFEQNNYQLALTVDGATYTWTCEPADYGPADGNWDLCFLHEFQQVYKFSIPRNPIPVNGGE